MKVDLYSDVNKSLVEFILGMSIDETNKEQVEIEMGTKMFLLERQLTKLMNEHERKRNHLCLLYNLRTQLSQYVSCGEHGAYPDGRNSVKLSQTI